jgi:HSP20 family protein
VKRFPFDFDEAFRESHSLDFVPRADVYRTPSGWVVKFDLAGVRTQDVTVEASGTRLRVTGVRRDRFVERGYRHHSMEISYSRFERTLSLPCDCDSEQARVSSELHEGMLIVTIETKKTS